MFRYAGKELNLFMHAQNWKSYWSSRVSSYVRGRVLEVGAGIGSNTVFLSKDENNYKEWLCIEPDANLCNQIQEKLENQVLSSKVNIKNCTVSDLNKSNKFDTILYIDVLEHIENDLLELQIARTHLTPNGKIVILSPAHNFLYSEFDKSIGHYRRYNKKLLKLAIPKSLSLIDFRFLDTVGLLASLANKLILKSSSPTKSQILFWDRFMVPISLVLDRIFCFRFGKSLIAVLERK